jgi:radical SAM superfamily enzyme YgiQ (UPF0313 family)
MKLLFVNPSITPGTSRDAMEPLVFGVLASLTPDCHDITFTDERLGDDPFGHEADLVAITVQTYTASRAYAIARDYRDRGIKVVLGGFHTSLCPDESLEHADSIVIGDAEAVWSTLLTHAENGTLRKRYLGGPHAIDHMQVDRRIFAGKRYAPIHVVQTSRGCRFHCEFCSIHAMYGADLQFRDVDDIARELRALPRRQVVFADDNFFASIDRVNALLDAMEGMNLTWACQASVDLSSQPDLLARLRRAGCVSVTVGFESLHPESLAQMRKPWNHRYGNYRNAVQRFREHGIMVYGSFACGYDHDTPEEIAECLAFALDAKLFLANFMPLTPTPGTELYDRLRAEGRLLHEQWWLDPEHRYGDVVYQPARMTPEQLRDACWNARRQFNRYRAIAQRAFDHRANFASLKHAGLFLAANLASRREIRRKQGQYLTREDR